MSQYPPAYPSGPIPYQSPGTQFNPLEDLLAPAKRAGILMIIVGSLGILCGGCASVVGVMFDQIMQNPQMPAQQRQVILQAQAQAGVNIGAVVIGMGVAIIIGSLVYLVMGIIVRRGRGFGVYGSMVLSIVCAILLAFGLLGTLLQLSQMQIADVAINLIILTTAMVSQAVIVAWLVQAARNIRRIREMQDYQNYYMYAQQQAAYQQNPYGQGAWPGYPQQPQPPQEQPPQYPNWPPQPPQA